MEKETELYLIERIRTLENENAYLKSKEKIGKPLPLNGDDNISTYKGYDVKKLLKKAQAFDFIVEKMQLSVCQWVESGKFEMYCFRSKVEIDSAQFKEMQGVINEK